LNASTVVASYFALPLADKRFIAVKIGVSCNTSGVMNVSNTPTLCAGEYHHHHAHAFSFRSLSADAKADALISSERLLVITSFFNIQSSKSTFCHTFFH
jgi:hypothetical protein